jgi:hypothetical protein
MNLEHARAIAFGQLTEFDQCGCCLIFDHDETTNIFQEDHCIPCICCNMPHGSCIVPPQTNVTNLRGVMVGRLARDNPSALADIDRFFYGETCNPCSNRRELLEKYISFIERVYPRRCCDDQDEIISSRMAMDVPPIIHNRPFCPVCCEFFGGASTIFGHEIMNISEIEDVDHGPIAHEKHGKWHKRHFQKNGQTKIVSGIIDCAIQPTLGILFGQRGNSQFRRELHRLSRDMSVRNCGAGYILKKAMACIPNEVWERPFALNESEANYIPSK